MADLFEVYKNGITIGELVSVAHSFQNLNTIDDFFGKMLGVTQFIKQVSEFRARVGDESTISLKEESPDFREKIGELVRVRHLVVHHGGFRELLDGGRLVDLTMSLAAFVWSADRYLGEWYEVNVVRPN